ncbi:MAG: hypothetical protein LBQ20_03120 [Rhodanobacter sp.]|jgi:hypothetical protein|nr:hypothetical protein [Rhodanobacter sp.]
MKRRTRNLTLLALTAVLLGAAVFAQLQREQAMFSAALTGIDPTAVRSLSIAYKNCAPHRYEKTAGHWQSLEPGASPADDAWLDMLARIANAPVRFRHAAGELEPAKLGLDPPLATLVIDGVVLKFGATDAIQGDRYVEVNGAIAMVPDRFIVRLFAAPEPDGCVTVREMRNP